MSRTTTRSTTRSRVLVGVLAGAVLAVGAPLAASAHVHVTPSESAAESTSTLTFSFSHGCDDSPTTALVVDIPDGVTNVVPVLDASWAIDRVVAENGTVSQVTYTAVTPVENGIKGEVSMDVRFSADLADSDVAFPVTQECVEGSTAWVEPTVEGEEEPEAPAPIVAVGGVAEDDGHGHGSPDADAHADHDDATDEDAGAGDADAAAATSPIDTAALWLGGGGLALGAIALIVALTGLRRRRA